jgi:hypothetical protein
MENKAIWDAVSKPPISALKQIQAGRLKGKSDISPQWRYQVMTEQFGPCGVGWRFTVDKKWTEQMPDGQIMCFVDISLFILVDYVWSEPIPGNGGSMLYVQESKGMHASDEGYKMATTDAIGTAMKMLGVAAEVYAGNFDGSKYINQPQEKRTAPPTTPQEADPNETKTYAMHPNEAKDVPDSLGEQGLDEALIIADLKKAVSDLMGKAGIKTKESKKDFFDWFMVGKDMTVDNIMDLKDNFIAYKGEYLKAKDQFDSIKEQ